MPLRLKTRLLHSTPALPPSPSKKETDYAYTQFRPTQPISRLTNKGFWVRVAISVVLEAGFVLLCALCLLKPRPFNLPLSLSNAKSLFTVISILWQLALTMPLGDVTQYCFSSEWHFQLIKTNSLVPGRTDVVSILTAGMLDRLKYALTPRASNRFRIAFVIMLMSMGIRAIFPGSISPASVLHEMPTKLQITRAVTSDRSNPSIDSKWFFMWLTRGYMIGELEQQKVVSFGLEPPKGWMVGWPSTLGKNLEGRLRYPTDTVHFDYRCQWGKRDLLQGKPQVNAPVSSLNVTGRVPSNATVNGTALLPVNINLNDSDYRIAFLLSVQSSPKGGLNPDGLPTFNGTGTWLDVSGITRLVDAPVAALLVCDPHVEYSGGEAQLYPNSTITITHTGNPPIGNIDNSTGFLGSVFRDSVSNFFFPDVGVGDLFTLSAIQAFLPSLIQNTTTSDDTDPVSPLSLEQISSNLNGVATSIAKSFSSGAIIGENFGVPVSSLLLDVDGWMEREMLVLETNPRLFCIGIGLWLVTICMLAWLGWEMDWENLRPFALDSIMGILKGERATSDIEQGG